MARKVILECPVCNSKFQRKGRTAYCSTKCKDKAREARRILDYADQRERTRVCKQNQTDYIDPKWLIRGDDR